MSHPNIIYMEEPFPPPSPGQEGHTSQRSDMPVAFRRPNVFDFLRRIWKTYLSLQWWPYNGDSYKILDYVYLSSYLKDGLILKPAVSVTFVQKVGLIYTEFIQFIIFISVIQYTNIIVGIKLSAMGQSWQQCLYGCRKKNDTSRLNGDKGRNAYVRTQTGAIKGPYPHPYFIWERGKKTKVFRFCVIDLKKGKFSDFLSEKRVFCVTIFQV